jgi:hypothetical protein
MVLCSPYVNLHSSKMSVHIRSTQRFISQKMARFNNMIIEIHNEHEVLGEYCCLSVQIRIEQRVQMLSYLLEVCFLSHTYIDRPCGLVVSFWLHIRVRFPALPDLDCTGYSSSP